MSQPHSPADPDAMTRDELIAAVVELRARVAELEADELRWKKMIGGSFAQTQAADRQTRKTLKAMQKVVAQTDGFKARQTDLAHGASPN